jgi:hypothetical protein
VQPFRPLVYKRSEEKENSHPKERNFFTNIFRIGGKIAVALGSGVTATRHALDVKFGVRIPAPQLEDPPVKAGLCFPGWKSKRYSKVFGTSLSKVDMYG